ncbi:SusC/RagA family TonB-linked outer membrane protein [Zobellia galactanivorans]|uniref:SusC/RagA family TonB-linked outer membrane protein n=1 Tax=Zobellia galactanivorans (strain DSM 12802 / CCUG 47099 / CIP 106680 / NCIMB 13871 / Dsij) TaxID=63186 RepID=UPI001C07158F|nr:TonB-dependent receptor [Zobellia galactanivorans]MBU3026237.1 TonB-dependent receptor [Zobellia galactanivorans]
MKRKKRKLNYLVVILLLFNFLGHGNLLAQETVTGNVKDDAGVPIPGVTVMVHGTTRGAATDFDGNFEIEASEGEVLDFSYIGFKKVSKTITSTSTPISIVMQEDTQQLDEVVIVGYGTQRKKEVTGAVVGLKSDIIEKAPVSDLGESIQGQIAGVNVQASDGRPGASANIQIRGLGSLLGSNTPLYVVDGIPFEGTPNIAPEQIQSIDVLKDGASAAVYGTRASNGVILITTKRGKEGKVEVDFSTYTGIQNITSGIPLMNTTQQMYHEEIMLEALGSDPLIFFFNPDALKYDSDYVSAVQNDNALLKNYVVGVNGGTKDLSMNFSANYYDQDGVMINSGFNRLSTRLNTQFTKGKFKLFGSLGLTYENTTQEPWGLYEYAVWQQPWQPPLNGLTQTGENEVVLPVRNAIAYSYLSSTLKNSDKRKVKSNNIAINIEYEILDGLTYKLNLGRNNWDYQRKFLQPQYLVTNLDGSFNATASREDAILSEDFVWNERNTMENILNFNTDFGKHNFNATGVLSYEKFKSKEVGVGVIGLLSNETPSLGAGQNGITPTSYDYTNTLSGLMGRLQYNYDGKYLFSASIRRDGSSNFSKENKYGVFPGVSIGWNISDENFLKNSDKISNLKLRGSWAEVGNQSIAAYSTATQIETGVNYLFDDAESLTPGYVQRRISNSDLKWETKISKNIGLDLSMFNNRFTFTADVYENERKEMLLPLSTPPSAGTSQPRDVGTYNPIFVNAGDMTNRGIELAASYKGGLDHELVWDVSATFTTNKNEITNLNGIERGYGGARPSVTLGTGVDYTTFNAVGYEAGAFFLVETDGVIKTQEELDAYKTIYSGAKLGDMRYVDQNGDNVIDDNDRVYKGSGQPEFEIGLNFNLAYKGFDLFVQNYFSGGAEIFNGSRYLAYTKGRHLEQYNMWSPQNPNSDIPTFRQDSYGNNVRARSDYWLEDGTYFRVRNITLGYTIPSETTSSIGLNKLRLYLSAMNPITITDYTGFDPEIGGNGLSTRGVDIGNYPVARRFLLGLQVKF